MHPSSQRFAQALAERIGEILPPPLTIRADGGNLVVSADGISQGGSGAAMIVEDDDDRTVAERVECAARAVLDGVQDDVSEYLTLPWPAGADGRMATAGVRADEARVHLWFGDSQSAAVITLRSIDLGDLAGR
jgi:hypothetical protein